MTRDPLAGNRTFREHGPSIHYIHWRNRCKVVNLHKECLSDVEESSITISFTVEGACSNPSDSDMILIQFCSLISCLFVLPRDGSVWARPSIIFPPFSPTVSSYNCKRILFLGSFNWTQVLSLIHAYKKRGEPLMNNFQVNMNYWHEEVLWRMVRNTDRPPQP